MYECLVGHSPIMRRCDDDWVNATQILKLCDFPKAKRTKILEKGVQNGQHQKVQGGYGRFQGTWIPLNDARNLAKEYGITSELVPVLYIDVNDPNLIIPKKLKPGTTPTSVKGTTPVKRKYVKKTPKETPKKQRVEETPQLAVYVPEFFSSMSSSQGLQQTDDSSGMHMPPVQMSQNLNGNMHDYSQMSGINEHLSADNSFKSYDNYLAQAGPGIPSQQQMLQPLLQPLLHPLLLQHQQNHLLQNQYPDVLVNTSGMDPMSLQHHLYQSNLKSALSHATNETNWSQEDQNRDSDTSISSGDAKHAMVYLEPSHAAQMLRYFSEDNLPIPFFIYNPTPDFDINDAIDDEGHTTLHWAASIGDLNLVLLVLSKGANPLVVSNYGMNPLSKCITFNNCYDLGNFQNVLNALEACLIHTDINGRTPLHYVCQFSKVRSKLTSLLHYTERMFKKIISIAGHRTNNGLDLFHNVLNHQDINGDTCLHLAARSACPEIYQYFLRHGARDDLSNSLGELAKQLILRAVPRAYDFNPNDILTIFDQLPTESIQVEQTPAGHIGVSAPKFPPPIKRVSANTLDTPIQPRNSHTVTPDTQRTTVQDDDEDEDDVNDRVSKDQLRSLMEESSTTVDDNKENIFLEDPKKLNYGAMSTPKTTKPVESTPKVAVVEKPVKLAQSPVKDYIPHPPKIDRGGKVIEENKNVSEVLNLQLKVPMLDVGSMLHGMVNSFTSSCEQELKELSAQHKRVQISLANFKKEEGSLSQKINVLMRRNGFSDVSSLEEATAKTKNALISYKGEVSTKESHLSYYMEKYQSKELGNLIRRHQESMQNIKPSEEDLVKLELIVSITKAQLKREQLVQTLLQGMKKYAIDNSMNKYRKLISLSCGLRVEDIDSLIDGIEESLSDGST